MKTPAQDLVKEDPDSMNEEAVIKWREPTDSVDGSSGIDRLKLKMAQDAKARLPPEKKKEKQKMMGYSARDYSNPNNPSSEPVIVNDQIVRMNPIVKSLPDWTDCIPGAEYSWYRHHDLVDGL